MCQMKRKLTKYTREYKTEAVQLALKSPCVTTTVKELGIPTATLHTWIKREHKNVWGQFQKKHVILA